MPTPITIPIMYDDLTENVQNELLRCFGISDPSEMNWETVPVAEVVVDEVEDAED